MLKSQWKFLPSTCGCSFVSPYALTVSVNAGRGVIRMYRWYILDYIAKPQCTHEATNIYSIRRWIYQDIDFMTKKEKSQPPKDFFSELSCGSRVRIPAALSFHLFAAAQGFEPWQHRRYFHINCLVTQALPDLLRTIYPLSMWLVRL